MMSQNELSKNRPSKKKQIAAWNRRLAWVTLFVLVVMNVSTYANHYKSVDWLTTTSIISSVVFILLLLIHSGFSVYLFGFPKFKLQIRVVHIYIGYLLFIFTFISQSISIEPYHKITYAIMWMFLIAHVTLSFRFMLKRNVKKQPEQSLRFRGE